MINVRVNNLKTPRPLKEGSETNVVAMASINIGGLWAVENVRVLKKGEGDCFLSMPQYKTKDKDQNEVWRDIAHPITAEVAAELREALAAAGTDVGDEMEMPVSVRVNALKTPRPLKEGSETCVVAMATVNLGGLWVVENCRVLKKGEGDCFLSMPQYKTKDKEQNEVWRDIAHPITAEGNAELREALAAACAEAGL